MFIILDTININVITILIVIYNVYILCIHSNLIHLEYIFCYFLFGGFQELR